MEPLPHNSMRQYIDAVSAFTALEEAQREADLVRGGMYWHASPTLASNTQYLIRTSPSGSEKSLGPRSPENEAIYSAFRKRKADADGRVGELKQSVKEHQRLNKALRVGRVDPLVVEIINQLSRKRLMEHFRVVGTHAVYAYEAEAGVRVIPSAVATQDIDFLWDVRKRVHFGTQLKKVDGSMLGVLQKVDPSFRIRKSQKYTAVNKRGFEVDIIRRMQVDGDEHPIRMSDDEDDFWVAQAVNANVLMDSPSFSSVIVATTGEMARMNTMHPLIFARFKRWMAALPSRDPRKKERDLLQAGIVEQMIEQHLPHLSKIDVGPELAPPTDEMFAAAGVSTGKEQPARGLS